MPELYKHHSIMVDLLRAHGELYQSLRAKTTRLGVPFSHCIKPGMDNPGHAYLKVLGIVAGDEECYTLFSPVFDKVIEKRHAGYAPDATHPSDMSLDKISGIAIAPTGGHVMSCRVRASRNVAGFRLPPSCDRPERRQVEQILAQAFLDLKDADLVGKYLPLRGSKSWPGLQKGMSEVEEAELDRQSFLFYEPDSKVQLAAGLGRSWPEARGLFLAEKQQMVSWLNEEDHMHLMAIQPGGDLQAAFGRFVRTMQGLEELLAKQGKSFCHTEHLGYITTCPSNLGTALRVSVMLNIPLFSRHVNFKKVCRRLNVHLRKGTVEGHYDIGNIDRFGSSEVDQVNGVIKACAEIVRLECSLERGEVLTLP